MLSLGYCDRTDPNTSQSSMLVRVSNSNYLLQICKLHMVLFKLEMILANKKLFYTEKKLYN
jgi:hypothetical protein